MPAVLASLLLYLGAALLGAVATIVIGLLVMHIVISRNPSPNAGLAYVFLIPMILLYGGPGGAVLGIVLRCLYQAFGMPAITTSLAVIGAAGIVAVLAVGIRQAGEQADAMRDRREQADLADEIHRLLDAARSGDSATVVMCLDGGTFVDVRYTHDPLYGESALMLAARAGDVGMVRLLLARGALPGIPNDRGQTPRMLAEEQGHTEVALLIAAAERASSVRP